MIVHGIEYTKPEVTLLQQSGIGVPELAARTCYDSFENSENDCVKIFGTNKYLNGFEAEDFIVDMALEDTNSIESSELLDSLAWVHHHHSILEHTTLSYLIKGTSRCVLQEHARHRIQAISVRSTRYTMSGIINAFVSSVASFDSKDWFIKKILEFNMFAVKGSAEVIEASQMYEKLNYQYITLRRKEFFEIAISKSSQELLKKNLTSDELFNALQSGAKKRNVGDAFKWIVTDNWKVDMVVTFNLRSLKNYFDLRDSGAAYFQIQELAKQMKLVTPIKYMRLIDKKFKDKK